MSTNYTNRKRRTNRNNIIPFRRKKNYKPFIIFVLFVSLCIYIALFTPIFNITNIEVIGNEKFTSNQIANLSGIPIGNNIFKVRYFEVKDNILKNQYIKNVKISRSYPGTVKFIVEERKPSAYFDLMGSFLIIDKEGIVLDVLKDLDNLMIPQIDGIKYDSYTLGKPLVINKEDTEKYNSAIECINSGLKYNLSTTINRIDFSNIDAIVGYTYNDKYTIKFVDSDEIDYKYKFLSTILEMEEENNVSYIIDFTSITRPSIQPKY